MLKKEGYNSISLGKMILRTETAAVVGSFLINIIGEKSDWPGVRTQDPLLKGRCSTS